MAERFYHSGRDSSHQNRSYLLIQNDEGQAGPLKGRKAKTEDELKEHTAYDK